MGDFLLRGFPGTHAIQVSTFTFFLFLAFATGMTEVDKGNKLKGLAYVLCAISHSILLIKCLWG